MPFVLDDNKQHKRKQYDPGKYPAAKQARDARVFSQASLTGQTEDQVRASIAAEEEADRSAAALATAEQRVGEKMLQDERVRQAGLEAKRQYARSKAAGETLADEFRAEGANIRGDEPPTHTVRTAEDALQDDFNRRALDELGTQLAGMDTPAKAPVSRVGRGFRRELRDIAMQTKAAAGKVPKGKARRAIIKEMDAKIAAAGDVDQKQAIRSEYDKKLRGQTTNPQELAIATQQATEYLGNILGPDITPESGVAEAVASDPVIKNYQTIAGKLTKIIEKKGLTPRTAARVQKLQKVTPRRIKFVTAAHLKARKAEATKLARKAETTKNEKLQKEIAGKMNELAMQDYAEAEAALTSGDLSTARQKVNDALEYYARYADSATVTALRGILTRAKAQEDKATSDAVAKAKAEKAAAEKKPKAVNAARLKRRADIAKDKLSTAEAKYKAANKEFTDFQQKKEKAGKSKTDFAEELTFYNEEDEGLKKRKRVRYWVEKGGLTYEGGQEFERLKAADSTARKAFEIARKEYAKADDALAAGDKAIEPEAAGGGDKRPSGPNTPGEELTVEKAQQYRDFYGDRKIVEQMLKRDGWSF